MLKLLTIGLVAWSAVAVALGPALTPIGKVVAIGGCAALLLAINVTVGKHLLYDTRG